MARGRLFVEVDGGNDISKMMMFDKTGAGDAPKTVKGG